MKTSKGLGTAFVPMIALFVAATLAFALTVETGWSADLTTSRLVVKLVSPDSSVRGLAGVQTTQPAFDALASSLGLTNLHHVFPSQTEGHEFSQMARERGMADWLVAEIPEGSDPYDMLKKLEACADVESVEFDQIMHIAGQATTPNDLYFLTHQYSLHNTGTQPPWDPGTPGADIEMEAAWDITTGDSSIVIAMIDTGIDFDHPEFSGRIWTNPGEGSDGLDLDGNGYNDDQHGYDFANNDPNPQDDHQHGSHVSGIAAANGNNGIGIAGMNWECKIMPLKVLNAQGSGFAADIAEAITYAVNEGAHVISLSLGGGGSPIQEQAIEFAVAAGVIVVAAMGNDNSGALFYPAAYDSVISVGATNSRDERALGELCADPPVAGSNFGHWIDVCAAGDNVWSTIPVTMGSYGRYCLTSQATPHVAGLATLILTLRPDYTADSVTRLIRLSAEDQVGLPAEDTPGFDIYHGWGRINARAALQALAMDFSPILSVPGPQTVTELETLVFTVSATDSNFTNPILSAGALSNATFVDSGNGVGTLTFSPDITQQGQYNLVFAATDGVLADSATVTITVIDGCICPYQGDSEPDGFITALDLSTCIDILFAGAIDIQDVGCPSPRFDLDCDGFTTALDLSILIDYLFAGGSGPCEPCLL